ncbi:hypothetical protein B0E33_24830 [Roseibium algicola]|jgi:hypothetical protein|uniref:OmpA family protein n=1 Tax=Roseibium algicola TaxID=2857014 RepID=A0ABM6I7J5_9HYPH|nr:MULTISPECIES: OmpA family protein [Stappiaceae]MCR9282764.1 OmpA family protein [Paracoccaceae bacterium]MEC9417806.1 OmpA family protein [Pseudomonadota bacterium]AQQ06412.1 hypothetical protein B0E33_24830 [Roseibium aggregatum]ERP97681.1 hypothetical protein Q669_20975 [Labrenzia sp. C1B10]ERS01472.1 hypothetical protein Q675_05085 [Labrenzia sp. C1B70]
MSGNYVVDHRDGVITLARLQYFDVSQANLKEDHKNWLRRNVVPLLKGNGSISIVGLSSRSGKAAFNKALSMKRANAVKTFLEECLLSCFPFDLVDGLGESLAEEMGQEDGVEDGQFRAVMIYVHSLPTPPNPKVIKTPKKMKPKPKAASTLWVGIGESHSGDLVAVGRYNWNGRLYRASADDNGYVDYVDLMADGWKIGGGLGGSVGGIVIVAHGVKTPSEFNKKGEWSDWDLDLAIAGKLGDVLKGIKGIGKIVNTMEKYEELSHAAIELTKNKGFVKKGLYTIPMLGVGAGLHVWTGRKYGDVSVISVGRTLMR